MDVQQIAVQVGIKAPHDATAYTIDTELSAKLHDITRGFEGEHDGNLITSRHPSGEVIRVRLASRSHSPQ